MVIQENSHWINYIHLMKSCYFTQCESFFEPNPSLCIPRAFPVDLDAQGKPGQYTRWENLHTAYNYIFMFFKDERRRLGIKAGQFLLLGSTSQDLLQQSSESLAGRIIYCELSGLNLAEVGADKSDLLWLRGGFPDSFLAKSQNASFIWFKSLIRAYLHVKFRCWDPKFSLKPLAVFGQCLPTIKANYSIKHA